MYFVSWLLIDKYNIVVLKVEGSIKKYRVIYEQAIFIKIFSHMTKETSKRCIHLIYIYIYIYMFSTSNKLMFDVKIVYFEFFEEKFFWKYWNVHGFLTRYFLIELLSQW